MLDPAHPMASGKAAQPHNAGAQPQIHWTSFVRRHHSFLGTAIDQRIGRWRLAWLHCFGYLGRKATAGGQGTAAALETVAQQTHGRRQGVKCQGVNRRVVLRDEPTLQENQLSMQWHKELTRFHPSKKMSCNFRPK